MAEERTLAPVPSPAEPVHMLVIVAHHDDIEFGCAGSVARWIDQGHQVTYVIITDGGSGSNDPAILRRDLVATRRREQIAAAQVVGVHDVRFLDYPDGVLEASIALRRDLTRIIRELKPYRVVAQDPTLVFAGDFYINHPDHRAAGEAATYATFPSAESRPIFADLLVEGYEPHKVSELYLMLTDHATHYEDITGVIDRKIEALRCHQSQIGDDAAEPGASKWIRRMNRESGERAGVQYAEIYRVMKFDRPRDDDPETSAEAFIEEQI